MKINRTRISIFSLALFALALALIAAESTLAASFSIQGGGIHYLPPGATGQLQIQYDPAPQGNITFANGGVRLKVENSWPQVIKFTGATILDSATRWHNVVQILGVTANGVAQFNAFSVGSPGLSASTVSTFATIDYEVVGFGTTTLSLGVQGEDPLYDGKLGTIGEDVSDRVQLIGTQFSNVLPEPGTLAMCGIGLLALILRRRKS